MDIIILQCIAVNVGIGIIVLIGVLKRIKENSKSITPEQIRILHQNIPFYRTLDEAEKKRFNHRMAMFLEMHEFSGREGLELTEEMIITIAGAGIHLTFGLNDFLFLSFRKIYVYPEIYYSPFTKTVNKGETNPHGIIAFSWPDLKGGFDTTEDKINLGYHEFAHALILQESQDELNDHMFEVGYQLFSIAMQKFKIAKHAYQLDFLRDYAFTNKMEFFAVCAENFMESPETIYEKFPGLYEILSRMLRSDPINKRIHLWFFYGNEPSYECLVSDILERDEPY